MKRISFYCLLIIISLSACKKLSKYEGVPFTEKEPRDWENPAVFNINREDPNASFISFADESSALEGIKDNSPNYKTLDGIWKFFWVKSPNQRPFWFFKDDYDTRDWKDTKVPSNWQMQGFDIPVYTNIPYPFWEYEDVFNSKNEDLTDVPTKAQPGDSKNPPLINTSYKYK